MEFKVTLRQIILTDEDTGQTRKLLAVSSLDEIVETMWEREQELAGEIIADTVFSEMSNTT
ncbi:hypothetical protein ACFLYO_01585 [Chloroflexota bacterium]